MEQSNNILDNISSKIFSIIKQFFIIVLYILIAGVVGYFCSKDMSSSNFILANLSSIFVELVILTIFILIFRKTIIPDFYDFKTNAKKYINNYWHYWAIGLFVMIISNLIISSFIGMPSNEETNRNLLSELPLYSMIAMVIFAPITEELMTRIILNKSFKNPYIYALLSGLIFGSLHLVVATSTAELFYIIPYSALGFAFALIYRKSNNICANIFFHSLHNFIALVLIFIGG